MSKPKVAFYWCSSCGGCEEATVDLNETLLAVADLVDIVLWPVALDFKYSHVEALEDKELVFTMLNGAIRTSEQAEMAKLLRQKSQYMVAFGACAHLGGIPGLANLTTREHVFEAAYGDSPTNVNPEGTVPSIQSKVHEVDLPSIWEQVHSLDQVVEVDFYLPGCPPPVDLIVAGVTAFLEGKLPPRGSVIAPDKTLCDTCPRRETKDPDAKVSKIYRPHEIIIDPDKCFLDQGVVCVGPATRSGCGETCIDGNMPCTGCMGPGPGVVDQGAKMLSALASLIDADTREEAEARAREIVDPAGTFYRYAVPASLVGRKL